MPEEDKLPLGKRPIDVLEQTGEVVGQVLASSPTLRAVGGTISFLNKNLKSYAKQELEAGRGQLDPAVAIGSGLSLMEDASNVLRERATAFAEERAIPAIEQAIGQEVDPRAAGLYGEAVGAIPGEVAAAGLGKAAKVLKNVELPPPPMPRLQTANAVVNFDGMQAARANLEVLNNQPMKIASNMEVSGWEKSVKTLVQEQADPEQIKRVLSRPYHKDLKKAGYEYVSLDDIAKNKDNWLTALINRAEDLGVDMKEYRRLARKGSSSKANQQRIMYDNFTDNPRDVYKQMYDPNNPIRKAVAQTFNTVLGKEWHHIFGNKEAAEFMLAQVAQDPYIAANLFEHMKKIGLATSGKADNISLIGVAGHRKRGGYHSWSKKLGLENKGRKKGDLEISSYGQAISESILAGETGVEELFSILEVYARVNAQVIKPKLAELGGQTVSEMGQVSQFVQGVAKRNPKVGSRIKSKN